MLQPQNAYFKIENAVICPYHSCHDCAPATNLLQTYARDKPARGRNLDKGEDAKPKKFNLQPQAYFGVTTDVG